MGKTVRISIEMSYDQAKDLHALLEQVCLDSAEIDDIIKLAENLPGGRHEVFSTMKETTDRLRAVQEALEECLLQVRDWNTRNN